jgi:hypothetical protein
MSASPYEPAPPAPPGPPAPLVNGRPMSNTYSFWPDKRPVATPRQHLGLFVSAAVAFCAPFAVDLVGGPPWQAMWVLFAFGVGFVVQAGMDTARPRAEDRVGVVVYRVTYLLTPVLVIAMVLLLGGPAIYPLEGPR